MVKTLYVTTPIFYASADPHLGHAYTATIVDSIARYKKTQGYRVYFQTGSDDHGEKIAKKANILGITEQELVDNNSLSFRCLFKKLRISKHVFFRTSSLKHKSKVQTLFKKLLQQQDIYLDSYQGDYCVSCETFVTNSDGADLCPDCSLPLNKLQREPAYFLKVTKCYQWLREQYEQRPDLILPVGIKTSLLKSFLNEDVRDLCISRSATKLQWGIPVPDDAQNTIYVWFDALLNYVTSIQGNKSYQNKDTEIIHVVGKDIARFHGVYLPIILHLLSYRLFNVILAHGWILSSGEKMSKSKGNVINPLRTLETYPVDALRAYFISQISFLQDGSVSEEALNKFYQTFLINNLGNLVSRVHRMLHLYCEGKIPAYTPTQHPDIKAYVVECQQTIAFFQKNMNAYELSKAFRSIEDLIANSNSLINKLSPWGLITTDPKTVSVLLNCLVNSLRITAFALNIFLPNIYRRIMTKFSLEKVQTTWANCLDFTVVNDVLIKNKVKRLYEPLKQS